MQSTSWASGLELVGDNERLVAHAGALAPRPVAGRLGLTRGLSAGFSHELLEHIAANGGKRGRPWEFPVGWSCTGTEMGAIARLPKAAWTSGIDQNGDVLDDTLAAGLTGLLDLDNWTGRSLACGYPATPVKDPGRVPVALRCHSAQKVVISISMC